jgi:hypothetical protein
VQIGLSDHPRFNMSLTEFLDFAAQLRAEHVEIKLDRLRLLSALFKADEVSMFKKIAGILQFWVFFACFDNRCQFGKLELSRWESL